MQRYTQVLYALLMAPVAVVIPPHRRRPCFLRCSAAVCGLRPQLWERLFLVVMSLPLPGLACLHGYLGCLNNHEGGNYYPCTSHHRVAGPSLNKSMSSDNEVVVWLSSHLNIHSY